MRNGSHITLDDIAKKLSVSRVTVSKALRGHSDISVEMTKKVIKTAKELGYSPNIIARSLSSRRSNMIGIVVPKIAHYFFSRVIEGVYDTAFENRYETILTVSQENSEREWKHLQTLVSMRVDGIIISISQETQDLKRFKWIRKMGIPLVFVDRRPEAQLSGFSTVSNNDREGAFQAVEHAIKIGYRKIGFIGGNLHINIGKNRIQGFEDALNEYRIPINHEWILQGGFGKEDGYNGLKHFHQKGSMPEFIFAATYPVALGIYEAAKELGVRIPDDVDIICFGDSDVARFLSPALSAVRQPARELGARAVQILLENINNQKVTKEHHVILPTELVIRGTCAAKKAQSNKIEIHDTPR
ncbi:MAG: LacI family DNA-binding transcriptional regulator [Ignavibacteriales bacterium]|nr:LacI family DNA-binding transcriptional regulator [Ignavibacteriales bacterium]